LFWHTKIEILSKQRCEKSKIFSQAPAWHLAFIAMPKRASFSARKYKL